MKWYKHLVDSGDDPDIDDAISLFGPDAYYVFFRTLEIMSREFDYKNPGKNEFSVTFFKKKFRISWKKTVKVMQYFDQRGRIFSNFSNNCKLGKIELYCPKLQELCDEHSRKKMSKKSGVSQESVRNESRAEPEAEAEAEPEAEPEPEADYLKKQFFNNEFLKSDEINLASKRKIFEYIEKSAQYLKDKNIFSEVDSFIEKMRNKKINERAILHSLIRCSIKCKFDATPWHYCSKIIQIENGNYNEIENGKIKA